MKDSAPLAVYEARRANLTDLLSERGAKTALAIKMGVTQAHISHLLRAPSHKNARPIHEDAARAIEYHLGLQPFALDTRKGAAPHKHPATQVLQVQEEKTPYAVRAVDSALLEEAVRAVMQALGPAAATRPPEKVAATVRLVYEHAQAAGAVVPAFVQQLVKLTS